MSPQQPEPMPMGSGVRATWGVPHQATTVADDPFSGWLHVYADADARAVYLTDPEDDDGLLEPAEARALARALVLAADHAEDRHSTVMQAVTAIRDELSDVMGSAPDEEKRAAHRAVQAFSDAAFRRAQQAQQAQRERAARADR